MKNRIVNYLETLRFPILLIITTLLFLINVFIPDVIPFVDEVLLALVAILLSRLKRKPDPRDGVPVTEENAGSPPSDNVS